MKSLRASIAVLVAAFAVASFTAWGSTAAQESSGGQASGAPLAARQPESGLQVFVMTMGPGQHVWERFGHNAIWIRDTAVGTDLVYNYGMFDFEAPGFVWNFVKARGVYRLEAMDLETTLRIYDYGRRQIDVQELALSSAQKAQLAFMLAQNALPENREYRYDYFLDNCSTRIRDILDIVLGGALRQASEDRPAEGTYRWHTQRSVSNNPGLYLGILAGQGARVDDPLDQWGEMFLPAKVAERVRELRVQGDDGREVPLVQRESTLLAHDTWHVEPTQPDWTWPLLGIGVVIALVIATGAMRGTIGVAGRTLAVTWAMLQVVGGVVLLFLWFGTNHVMSAWNANVLLFSPLAIVIPVLMWQRGQRHWSKWLAVAYLVFGLLGAIDGLGQRQDNSELVALMLPPSIAALGVALLVNRRRAAVHPSPT